MDNELWLDQNLSVRLSPKTSLQVKFAERANQGASDLFQVYGQVGVAIQAKPWLVIAPVFRHDRHDPFDPGSRYENRPLLDVTARRPRGSLRPILRTRFEGRFFENQDGFLSIRIRPGFAYALPLKSKLRPGLLVDDEIFYDTRAGSLNRNRLRAGVSFRVNEHFSLRPYYMLESNRRPAFWDHDNIWGLSLFWRY
ncbi:MAG TPA: DUF2490 domain-containing protein [Terriglobia bacterium]|nr:DUF2490 domain-containing protein [Terriglobia bacterium]